jgi:7,8-dihydroneopterin aldolase/epimerase/oxygenase
MTKLSNPPPLRRVFIRDLRLDARIGVYPEEQGGLQPILVNISLGIRDNGLDHPDGIGPDEFDRVVDYDALAKRVRRLVATSHVFLIETLAERIAALCLSGPRVLSVRIQVEKLAVFADAASAGVEIVRAKPGFFPPER